MSEITNNNEFPHVIKDLDPTIAKQLMYYFKGELTGFVLVGDNEYLMPYKYKHEAKHIYNMDVRTDDVWVVSYPRSGTTWTQELVWLLANDLDYEGAANIPLTDRFPFLEFYVCVHEKMMEQLVEENSSSIETSKLLAQACTPGWQVLMKQTTRRFIKTHMPFTLLPPQLLNGAGAKVVYIARDPRDVVVSFYHLNKLMRTQGYVGDFKTFWNFFRRGLHHWTPYFSHVKEAWSQRNNPNLLFLFYEELSMDLASSLRKVATFLGKDYNNEQIKRLCDHLDINNFRNNQSVNYDVMKIVGIQIPNAQPFIRRGKSGGWKEYFDDEMCKEAEIWIQHNLKDTDLRFPGMEFD